MTDVRFRNMLIAVTIVCVAFAAVAVLYLNHKYDEEHKPKVLSEEQVKEPKAVAREIHVTEPAANTIVREIEKSSGSTPAITYYIQSPDTKTAAEQVQKQIETKDPAAPEMVTKKSDRTIISPTSDNQAVNVYKITLKKEHKIKTGMTVINRKIYPTIGYQAGRWETLAQLNADGIKGGTVMYTLKEW
nr:MAG TPA: hypothetical protein [Caudoviricetes sp.]